jgi:hypothetical protein
MPPDAKRPYFQEGFLAGTEELTPLHERRSEYDFAQILVAKYKLVGDAEYWKDQLESIDYSFLYPPDDEFCDIASKVAWKLSDRFGDSYSSGALSAANSQPELYHTAHKSDQSLYTQDYLQTVRKSDGFDF